MELNGNANGTGPDGGYTYPVVAGAMEMAKAAWRRADSAVNHALESQEAVGRLTVEVSGMRSDLTSFRTEIRSGFEQLGATVKNTEAEVRKELESFPEIADDSASHKVAEFREAFLQQQLENERAARLRAESEARAAQIRQQEKDDEAARLKEREARDAAMRASDRRFHVKIAVLSAVLALGAAFISGHFEGSSHVEAHSGAILAH